MTKRLFKLVLSLILVFVLFLVTKPIVMAQDCDQISCDQEENQDRLSCLSTKIACSKEKIAQAQASANTLNNTINIFNGQINVLQLQIDQNLVEINSLEKEIVDLSDRIDGLNYSLDKLTSVLMERVNEHYKRTYSNPVEVLFSKVKFSTKLSEFKYLQLAEEQTVDAMHRAENQKITYDEQKLLKVEKQDELENKKKELETSRRALDQQKQEKQDLLNVTKNDEKKYQQLLAEAQAEVTSLKSFTANKVGGVLSPQNSPDGWYFSQRDERWAGVTIGRSPEIMYEVGCLVSSTAMIKKKFGEDVTPTSIAANNSNFFSNTANMLKPWPAPNGYYYVDIAYSQSKMDEELSKNPIIVKLLAGAYGTHFIVIKEKKDNEYIIYDPWEGYDKKLSDFYSLSQIARLSVLRSK